MRKVKRNRYGFTIIEILISAGILVTAITAVAVIISRGSTLNHRDLLRRRAYQIIERNLESPELSYKNYLNLVDSIGSIGSSITQDLGEDTIFNVPGSEPVIASVQRRMLREQGLSYTENFPKWIRVTLRVTYDGVTDSLETLISSEPLD